jgi:acyl-CoA reductase-like NAD-dependent aldehyde dehydrogenase
MHARIKCWLAAIGGSLHCVAKLAQLESLDNGKPFTVARGADVPLAADLFHYIAGWATKLEGNTINISVPKAGAGRTRPAPAASLPSAAS